MAQQPPRPPCNVILVDSSSDCDGLKSDNIHDRACVDELQRRRASDGKDEGRSEGESSWKLLAKCGVHFTRSAWLEAMEQLIEHPERNSTSILRADILSVSETHTHIQERGAEPEDSSQDLTTGYKLIKRFHRRILPRRPNLDGQLEQVCEILVSGEAHEQQDGLVIYTCIANDHTKRRDEASLVESAEQIPYYHPKVRAIAFRYQPITEGYSEQSEAPSAMARMLLYVLPFEEDGAFSAAAQPAHRLSRTAIALLQTHAAHSWGLMHDYQKRVQHDVVVPRKDYMDTYQALKLRHATRLMNTWQEKTDADKHVFEDLGIAAFLMVLWRYTFGKQGESVADESGVAVEGDLDRWPRPNFFVDVGCGNGLLVHILNAEGYEGFGFDLRERKSWQSYREAPGGADLRVVSLDAPTEVLTSHTSKGSNSVIPPGGAFLIGNHADELTPWLPLLAYSIRDCSGLVNIPCCAWGLDGKKYARVKGVLDEDSIRRSLGSTGSKEDDVAATIDAYERGPPNEGAKGSTSQSRNVAFLQYVCALHLWAGWHIEKEALRIPSTKNWAIVSRRRICSTSPQSSDLERIIDAQVQELVQGALKADWKARKPEGKGGH